MTVTILADFVRQPPGAGALDRALLFPGGRGLRVSSQSGTSGLFASGDYFGFFAAVSFASGLSKCILLDGGRLTGIDISYHTDPVDNGNHAICITVTSSADTYCERYEIADPRAPSGEHLFHSIEYEYANGFGGRLWIDGVEITRTDADGVQNTLGSGASDCALGGTINRSPTWTRGGLNYPDVVGEQSKWDSTGNADNVVDALSGAIAWVRIERSVGVPIYENWFDGTIHDEVQDSSGYYPNNTTNGHRWQQTSGSIPAPAPTFLDLRPGILEVSIDGEPVAHGATLHTGSLVAGSDDAGLTVALANTGTGPLTVVKVTMGNGLTLAEPFTNVEIGPGDDAEAVLIRGTGGTGGSALVSIGHNGMDSPFEFTVAWGITPATGPDGPRGGGRGGRRRRARRRRARR